MRIRILNADPGLAIQINADPDPQPWHPGKADAPSFISEAQSTV